MGGGRETGRGESGPQFSKKQDMADYANYRPITVPNTVAKVLESPLSKKIIESIDTHDKINMTRNTYLAITVAKLGLVTALKLSPVGRG